jgi:hypothetical protein
MGRWGVEREGATPTRCAGEVDRGRRDEVEKAVDISRSCGAQVRRGVGRVRVKP